MSIFLKFKLEILNVFLLVLSDNNINKKSTTGIISVTKSVWSLFRRYSKYNLRNSNKPLQIQNDSIAATGMFCISPRFCLAFHKYIISRSYW